MPATDCTPLHRAMIAAGMPLRRALCLAFGIGMVSVAAEVAGQVVLPSATDTPYQFIGAFTDASFGAMMFWAWVRAA